MWRNFLYWLTGFLPVRIINGPSQEPYLERYFLIGVGGRAVFLHRFVASDPEDRGLHSHPWNRSYSVLLSGGYNEIRSERTRRFDAPALNIIRGDDFHRIVLAPGTEAWSLFVHGRRVKGWGFLKGNEYSPHSSGARDHDTAYWWRTAKRGRALRAERRAAASG